VTSHPTKRRGTAELGLGVPGGLTGSAAVFLLASGLYAATLAPGVVWGDSADLAADVATGHLPIGGAGDHPLFLLLGRAVLPLPGELALKLNLMTAACGALAVALVYEVATRLGGSRLAGAGAAAALAFSHAFWHYSVIAGVRTLNALFLALLLWLLVRWRAAGAGAGGLVLPAAVFLLGLTNHLVLFLALPGLVFFVAATRPDFFRGRRGLGLGAGLVLAASLALLSEGRRGALAHLWLGPPPIYHYVVRWPGAVDLAREVFFYVAYFVYQFPVLALLLGLAGLRGLVRRDRQAALALLLVAGVNGFVFVKTTEWQSLGSTKFTFYLPDYLVFAIMVGVGLAEAAGQSGRTARAALVAALALLPAGLYAAAPPVLGRLGLDVVRARDLPFRDEARFFLTPGKRGDDSARRYGEAVLRVARPGAAIVADFTPLAVLRYLQVVEGRRPDIVLLTGSLPSRPIDVAGLAARRLGEQPLYLAGAEERYYDLAGVVPPARLVPRGPILEIVPPDPARPSGGDRVR
jgi:hypothetical protein